jgi:hypothetical protein
LEGAELVESRLKVRWSYWNKLLKEAAETPYEKISNGNLTAKDWKRAEQNRGLGYDGHASRTQRKHSQNARDKAESDKIARKSWVQRDFDWLQITLYIDYYHIWVII